MVRILPKNRHSFSQSCLRLGALLVSILASGLSGLSGRAAEPKLEHLYPVAGQRGTTVSVTATGKFDPWPTKVWIDADGVTFKPADKPGKFDVEISKDAPLGPHLVRTYNAEGVSDPRYFIVSRDPEIAEVEPNDDFKAPQKIGSLPATISGRLDKPGDVDSFGVTLRQGQTLVAWIEAYVLASTFDGMLRIVDEKGVELAFNQDGRTFDPFLAWEAPRNGTFVVQLMGFEYPPGSAERFAGGEGCVYRLHLTNGPFLQHTMPLAVQRGKVTPVELLGWNLTARRAEIDATQVPVSNSSIDCPLPGVLSDQPITVSDVPEILEIEPNDTVAYPQQLALPCAINGRISRAGDEDRFTFDAVKQETYELQLTAANVGSPLVGWIQVENKDGKVLERKDGADDTHDPILTWTAGFDGPALVAVGDVTHHGGNDYVYRLAVSKAGPRLEATVSAHSTSVQPGKTVEMKISLKRINGFKAKLRALAKNLPEGVTAAEIDVPEKDAEIHLKLTAAADAKPASGPFEIILREPEGQEHLARYFMTSPGKRSDVLTGYTHLVIESTDQLWMTVLPADAPKSAPAK